LKALGKSSKTNTIAAHQMIEKIGSSRQTDFGHAHLGSSTMRPAAAALDWQKQHVFLVDPAIWSRYQSGRSDLRPVYVALSGRNSTRWLV